MCEPLPVNIELVTSGQAGLEGVHELLHRSGRRSLHVALQGMLGSNRRLRSSRLTRTHFKPGRKLATYYELFVDDVADAFPVAVTWFCGRGPLDERLPATETALRETIQTPFDQLWSSHAGGSVVVLAAPLDPVFPSLPGLVDPSRVPQQLSDGEHSETPRFVRYRPGQRHVLEYRNGGPSQFAKLYRPGESRAVADAVTAFADLVGHAAVHGVHVVRPAAFLDDVDVLVYSGLSGVPLSQRLKAGRAIDIERMKCVGNWLHAVHSVPGTAAPQLGERDLQSHLRAVYRAGEAMRGLAPQLWGVAERIIENGARQLDRLDAEDATLVHGDIKADHLLAGPDGVTVLDTDRCARADPALDVGKLIADLRWWAWATGRPHFGRAESALLAGYGSDGSRLERARLYAALWLVKIAARRVSVAWRDWAQMTAEVLAQADVLLRPAESA